MERNLPRALKRLELNTHYSISLFYFILVVLMTFCSFIYIYFVYQAITKKDISQDKVLQDEFGESDDEYLLIYNSLVFLFIYLLYIIYYLLLIITSMTNEI